MRTSDGMAEGSDNATRRTMNAAGGAVAVAHTPGPWKQSSGCGVLSSEDGLIAVVYDGQDYTAELCGERTHVHAVSVANARLIAESPNLLAACEARRDKSTMTREAFLLKYNLPERADRETFCDGLELAAISRARGLA